MDSAGATTPTSAPTKLQATNPSTTLIESKWIGFKKLHSNLLATVSKKYGCTLTYSNGTLSSNEGSIDGQAIKEIEEYLSKVFIERIEQKPNKALYSTLQAKIDSGQLPVVFFTHDHSVHVCSESQSQLLELTQAIKPFPPQVVYASGVISTIKTEYKPQVQSMECQNLVKLCFDEPKPGCIFIRGYTKENVFKAKNELIEIVKSLNQQVKKGLSCSPAIRAYIHHVLFKQETRSLEHQELLTSLRGVKVTSEHDNLVLSGPSASIAESEEKLIKGIVPNKLVHSEYKFLCNQKFIPQIEQFLDQLHQKCDFMHLILCSPSVSKETGPEGAGRKPSSGAAKKKDGSDNDHGFMIFLYSTNTTDFSAVDSHAKELNPCTDRFQISGKSAAEYIVKRKNELEKKYCVRLLIFKSDPTNVTLHGLNKRDVAQCREEIEQSISVTRKFHITPQQLLYLRSQYDEKLKELEGKCQKFSLPPSQSKSDNPFILIVGKVANIETVVMELKIIVAAIKTDCKEEMFTLKCSQCLFSFWKQRWSDCSRSYKETLQVAVEFTPTEGPKREMHEDTLVNFKVSGKSHCVDKVVEIFKHQENGSSVQTEIDLPSSQQSRVNSLHRTAQLNNMKVWILPSEGNKKLIILAPSFCEEDLEAAKLKLESHFDNVETKIENVPCNDPLALDLFIANHAKYFDSIKEAGKRNRVYIKPGKTKHITLQGSKSGIEIVRPLVEDALKNIKKLFDTRYMQVKSIQAPYLETSEFQKMCTEIKKTKHVEVTVTENIVKYQAQMSEFVQLSIVHGDILVESVDGIVNTANEELAHRGGLAKTISNAAGPEVQKESTLYVATKGRVMTGQAVCLGAGNLSCKNIIHAVAPRYTADDPNVRSKLYEAVKHSLLASQQAGHTSIAIPALGSGIFAIPADICASASLQAVQDFANQNLSSCSLKEIRFVLISHAVCEAFVKETKKLSTSHTSCIGTTHVGSLLQNHSGTIEQQWLWLNDSMEYQPHC